MNLQIKEVCVCVCVFVFVCCKCVDVCGWVYAYVSESVTMYVSQLVCVCLCCTRVNVYSIRRHANVWALQSKFLFLRIVKVTLWSFWSRQLGGYFLLDYSVTYLLSCFVLCCTCLMFDCVRKVVDSLVCHKTK